MLCSTYSLLALSGEQQNARHMLGRFEHFVLKSWDKVAHLDNRVFFEAASRQLRRLHDYCCTRKLDVHVIPAIRRSTRAADDLLDELQMLGAAAMRVFALVDEQVRSLLERGAVQLQDLRFSIEIYCRNMQKKLSAEEGKLFPIVRGLLPPEEWFFIASQFIAEAKDGRSALPDSKADLPPVNRRKRPADLGFLSTGRNLVLPLERHKLIHDRSSNP